MGPGFRPNKQVVLDTLTCEYKLPGGIEFFATRVLAFKEQLASTKGLVWEYPNAASFSDVFRPHLTMILFEMFKERYGGVLPNLPLSVEGQPAPSQEQTMSLLNATKQLLRRLGWRVLIPGH